MLMRFDGRMDSQRRHVADARDTVRRRVSRATAIVAAASVAAAGSITAYVAGAAGSHRSVSRTATRRRATSTRAELSVPSTPAAPSLDSTGSSQAPAQPAQIQPPTQSSNPPVAVSGGS